MNVILIVSDTLRRDHLGCYGNDWISTPHLDRFAARSQVFDRAYHASFPTVPNRTDVATGRFSATYTPWAPLDRDVPLLSQTLSDAGYTTMLICDTPHMLNKGNHFDRGFSGFEWVRGQEADRWRTNPRAVDVRESAAERRGYVLRQEHRNMAAWRYESDRPCARTVTAAGRWLEDNFDQGPFFLWVDTFDPHEPWTPPEWYVRKYDPDYDGPPMIYPVYGPRELITEREVQNMRAHYAGEVTMVDRWVGVLLRKIEDMGLLDDTAVILTTDHGFLHGEHGVIGKISIGSTFTYVPFYDELAHIPLVVHAPDGKPGRRQAIVQPPDLMPTILDLAGASIPETVHGRSFAGVLRGGEDRLRDFAVSLAYLGAGTGMITVSKGPWTAMLAPRGAAGGRMDDDLTRRQDREVVARFDLAVDGVAKIEQEAGQRKDMLFAVDRDPKQERDLAEQHPEVLAELRSDAVRLFEETGAAPELIEPWRPGRRPGP